jgi:hypothetical protein
MCHEAQQQKRVDGSAKRCGSLQINSVKPKSHVARQRDEFNTCCTCNCSKQDSARFMNACQLPLLPLLHGEETMA